MIPPSRASHSARNREVRADDTKRSEWRQRKKGRKLNEGVRVLRSVRSSAYLHIRGRVQPLHCGERRETLPIVQHRQLNPCRQPIVLLPLELPAGFALPDSSPLLEEEW